MTTISTSQYLKTRKLLTSKGIVDSETGLPDSYESLFSEYHNLVLNVVRKAGLRVEDWEDAAANLEFKFWQKDGLSWFDPTKGTKFASMYTAWLRLGVLHERDKWRNYSNRHEFYDPSDPSLALAVNSKYSTYEATSEIIITQWAQGAREIFECKKYAHLLPIFDACVEASLLNEKLDHKRVANTLGIDDLTYLYKKLALMRNILKRHEIDPAQLSSLHD